jgi:voltage-gated potassium channel Kch
MPWRHLVLLISILLLFIVSPLVVPLRRGIFFLNIFGAGFLVAGSYALSEQRRSFIIAIVLSIISVIATSLLLAYGEHWAVLLSHSSAIILISFFSVTILGYVLGSGRVTADKIFAAICVYLLLGYGWTFIYAVLDELQPGSFSNLSIPGKDFAGRVMQLRYFSYMTLTTVGYGDVVPASPLARTLATLEAIMGQIYLAVLIARLVGLHIVHGLESQRRDD